MHSVIYFTCDVSTVYRHDSYFFKFVSITREIVLSPWPTVELTLMEHIGCKSTEIK